jgi:disulfide bond formation protein DsbB
VARHQFEDIDQDSRWLDNTTNITHLIVRAAGFILMFVGLWIGLKTINEAWSLYQQPQNIERLARAIEQGSNLDKALTSTAGSPDGEAGANGQVREVNAALGFRLSYFVAWVIAILLLMLIGRLAIAAVKTGGELALYDLQIKRFAKYLTEQASGAGQR